jgi:hypothetical protein
MRQNPRHRSLLIVISATSWLPFQPLHHQRNICYVSWPSCEPLYATNTSHHKQETFLYEYPLHWVLWSTKTHNRTLFFGIILLMHGCYLDCHEAGLCCYLVTSITQLFYLRLWPVYWLSLIHRSAVIKHFRRPLNFIPWNKNGGNILWILKNTMSLVQLAILWNIPLKMVSHLKS